MGVGQPAPRLHRLQWWSSVTVLHELHDSVLDAVVDPEVVDPHDAGMRDAGGGPGLPEEATWSTETCTRSACSP